MPKINYQIEMEGELRAIHERGHRPLLALHSCCAPCSSAVLERLNEHFRIALYYYNPNISPESEFRHRVEEQKRLVREMPLATDLTVTEGIYEPERFYDLVRGHEEDPEGGERCGICFEMRLRSTAEFARSIGADYFTTTLSISPLKDEGRCRRAAEISAEGCAAPEQHRKGAFGGVRREVSLLRLQEKGWLPALLRALRGVRPVPAGLLRLRLLPHGARPQEGFQRGKLN